MSSYQDYAGYQGVQEDDDDLNQTDEAVQVTPENNVGYTVTNDKEGNPQIEDQEPPSAPKNAQEVLGKTPQPEAQPEQEYKESGIDKWVGDGLSYVIDAFDGSRNREEVREDMRQGNIQRQKDREANPVSSVLDSTETIIESGVEKGYQDAVGFGNFVGDFAKTKLGMVDPDDEWNNVDHANYRGSERDLIMAEPRSNVGLFGRDIVSFVTLSSGVKATTGLGRLSTGVTAPGISGHAQRFAIERTAGAIADFMMDPSSPNLTGSAIKAFPALADVEILSIFASDEADNEWTRRSLNALEGAAMPNVVDAAFTGIRGIFGYGKRLVKWAKGNPGKLPSDAPAEVKAEAMAELTNALEDPGQIKDIPTRKLLEKLKKERAEFTVKEPNLDKSVKEVVEEFETLKKKVGEDKAAEAVQARAIALGRTYEQKGIDFESLKPGQKSLDLEAAGYDSTVRPGKEARLEESKINGGTKSRQDYEPFERGARTTEYPMERVIAENAADAREMPFSGGSPSPRLTDNTVRMLTEAGSDMEVIDRAVAELEGKFTPAVMKNDPKAYEEAFEQLGKLIGDNEGDEVNMRGLLELTGDADERAAYIRQMLGNKVAKVFLRELSLQASDLARQGMEIADTGLQPIKQYELILDRLEATTALIMRDDSRRGGLLQTLQDQVGISSPVAREAKVKEATTKFEEIRTKVREGDPEALSDMRIMADALHLSEGDPDLAFKFGEKFRTLSSEMFKNTMYNAFLSSLPTQGRNISGNSINVILKPAQLAAGATLDKDPQRVKAALAMYGGMWNDLSEAIAVGRAHWKSNKVDNISKANTGGAARPVSQTQIDVENMLERAKTPNERRAAHFLWSQYWFTNQPWMSRPTRMLDSVDRTYRTLSARQKARFDANMLAIDDNMKFDPDKFETVWSTKFKNGEIVDEDLMQWAKQDTYQQDLTLNMQRLADMLDSNWVTKFNVPFIKTPTNITKDYLMMDPIANTGYQIIDRSMDAVGMDFQFAKEYKQIMNGSDDTMKAVYKGKHATGVIVSSVFYGLGSMGITTGAGPKDPKARAMWLAEGNEPHSIKFPNGFTMSNRWLGPIGMLMSVYSDLGYVTAHRETYDGAGELMTQLSYTVAAGLMEQSWMEGLWTALGGVMELAKDASQIDPEEWAANISRALTPWHSALRSFNNTLTPGLRDYDYAFDKFVAETIPFSKRALGAERISMRTGKPVQNAGYHALNQVLPFGLNEAKSDPILNQLTDLGIKFPIEMTEKYRGEKLTAWEQNAINKEFAESGVWDDIGKHIAKDNTNFWNAYNSWAEQENPSPREGANWYLEITRMISEARTTAIKKVGEGESPEAQTFKAKVSILKARDAASKKGYHDDAARRHEQFKDLSKRFPFF